MGWFRSSTVFKTSKQLRQALFRINTLDYQQREHIYELLLRQLDDGGITSQELKETIRRLREQREISDIDRDNLLKLLDS